MMTAAPPAGAKAVGTAVGTVGPLRGGFALETDFRGDVRSVQWDTKDDSSLQFHHEFARAIAGAYDLPPAWSATYITYTSSCVV